MPRSFVIGDIHGNYEALREVFTKAGFNYDKDLLISLGDVVDRGPRPVKTVDELMKIRNFIMVMGNHDYWCAAYLRSGVANPDWLFQGGRASIEDYARHPDAAERHLAFFDSAPMYYIDESKRLFVHAGYDWLRPFSEQQHEFLTMLWDRRLYMAAVEYQEEGKLFVEFNEIFIGHSPTQLVLKDRPTKLANLWMMDTGAGHRRLLSLMDLDTKEFWQSKCDF